MKRIRGYWITKVPIHGKPKHPLYCIITYDREEKYIVMRISDLDILWNIPTIARDPDIIMELGYRETLFRLELLDPNDMLENRLEKWEKYFGNIRLVCLDDLIDEDEKNVS
jgi:hypothetical protein